VVCYTKNQLVSIEKRSRRKFTSEFKAKVVLEALRDRETIETLSRRFELHPTQVTEWKKEAIAKLSSVFGSSSVSAPTPREDITEKLYAPIGQLKVENDFLKKKLL
jgi:transposase